VPEINRRVLAKQIWLMATTLYECQVRPDPSDFKRDQGTGPEPPTRGPAVRSFCQVAGDFMANLVRLSWRGSIGQCEVDLAKGAL
jgi:hypothetical protein